ncbi:type II toxin-antitoxin system RelB/DinJ family antitoxin [Lactobacillus sp. ESL0791]|uniref:type II toxin-antitoxin system RelB/DinJ family antitoxin n=1 Tax=Lactobacillus sp. ESL0791 TaxID=2983234 RepID=UPI0023F961A5|nr:type II toxin-antitoxin system RelB/DinJ family antitoxin [Lactobacillus sp. ESL0791]MDF7638128.1 type II toxin-antitoxin system RelB/DinJ family antitoxin [Lactobacillus sp. ESL0791]
MTSANLNIRTDKEVKKQAEHIFNELGLNMSTAINIFLRQTIRDNGLPFKLTLKPNYETVTAIKDAEKIAKDADIVGYDNMTDLRKALEK